MSILSKLIPSTLLLSSILPLAYASDSPKAVSLKFSRQYASGPARSYLNRRSLIKKRDGSVVVPIYDAESHLLYLMNVTVGTPGQDMSLQLDTGSSDIWIPYASSTLCSEDDVCVYGSYDANDSSTFIDVASDEFEIAYVDGTKIVGDYIADTFTMADADVTNMTMGLATKAVVNCDTCAFQGIIGVGYPAGESIVGYYGLSAEYPNIIQKLKTQGFTNSLAYSLWLNDLDSPEGEILFGAIDTKKFEDPLVALPVQPDSGSSVLTSFTVVLDSIIINNKAGATQYYESDLSMAVILDSGTTLTYLPDDMATAIADGVGAVDDSDLGVVVPCKVGDTEAEFEFRFGNSNGPVIKVGINQFVLPFPSDYGSPHFTNGDSACQWGILSAGSDPNLFGDTFLRSAYVVYDIENNIVGIAQTVFNETDSNIEEISSTVPGISSTATGVVVTQSASGQAYATAGTATGESSVTTSAYAEFDLTGTSGITVSTSSSDNSNSDSSSSSSSSDKSNSANGLLDRRSSILSLAGPACAVAVSLLLGGTMIVMI